MTVGPLKLDWSSAEKPACLRRSDVLRWSAFFARLAALDLVPPDRMVDGDLYGPYPHQMRDGDLAA